MIGSRGQYATCHPSVRQTYNNLDSSISQRSVALKASSKLLAMFSVTGLSLAFSLGTALSTQAQQPSENSGGFAPQSSSAPSAAVNHQNATALPNGSHEALLKARQALARGEIASAKSMVDSARHFPIDNSLTSDTPAKVEAMIARHAQLVAMYDSGDSDAYNYGAAMFLLEQADQLLNYRDFQNAGSLIDLARSFDVRFKPGDLNPDHVMDRMQQMQSVAMAPARNLSATRIEAGKILSQAQLAFDKGQLDLAMQLISQVKALNLPENAFEDDTILPWELELKIVRAMDQRRSNVAQASWQNPSEEAGMVQQANYHPELDTTRNMPVAGTETSDSEDPFRAGVNDARGKRLYESGMNALTYDDRKGAMEYFQMAWQYRDQLDPATRQDLQAKLSSLNANVMATNFEQEEIVGTDDDLRRQMFAEVLRQRSVAQRMIEQNNPRGALNHMRLVRDDVQESDLDNAGKTQLTSVIEREIVEYERYIEQNRSLIDNQEMNDRRRQAVELDRQHRDDVERKIQALLNDFTKLVDEERYHEAEYLARQARDIAPDNPATAIMVEKIKLQANFADYQRNKELREEGFMRAMEDIDRLHHDVDGQNPMSFNENTWSELARRKSPGMGNYMSERERVIWSALKNQTIEAEFARTPLSEAIATLAERAGVNMIPDQRAMELEQVSIDSPVTMSFSQPISIESALNIILGNHGLVFKVENESVIITNRQALQANPVSQTYYVGDLVMPIPDFSGNSLNMQFLGPQTPSQPWTHGEMNNGFAGRSPDSMVSPVSYNAQQTPSFGGSPMWTGAAMPHAPRTSAPMYNSWGPKGVGKGGITEQDFEQLMDLIQETIDPDSWEENGGNGRMQPFPSTLSLIVTQTQENQDRIQNLLGRLRELNDVQIVVEVRFLTLSDDFFERIGIDLDLAFNDNTGLTPATLPDETSGVGGSALIGRLPNDPGITVPANLDIPLTQGSFGATTPTIPLAGNLADTGLNIGFAILSDIEVFFLLQAAKGDNRSNTTQAPTVTMFNGQSATVFSGAQRPFVTSIQPVVGDFAAAQQPIITILPEGTQLNVRAVASADRRFVRMTLVPFFSNIERVDEFRFDGSRTVRQGGGTTLENILDAINGTNNALNNDELEIVESGTTVQLPVFANTTVTTTVSVPDGGTVLLGGIKTMTEERLESGVPFLSNIPYVNRLFKNVGISRATASQMLMVSPRIIIQEEEEERQINANN